MVKKIMKQCLAGLLSFAMAVTLMPANAAGTARAAEGTELTIPNMDDIRGNITLPDKDAEGNAITWASDDEAVINPRKAGNTPAGVVTRQDTDKKVKLTATIEKAGGNETKEFNLTVKKKAEVGVMTDYVFAYFAGDGAGEKIFLATSRDGLNWEELNGGEYILKSDLGTTGLRDPYILRAPEGDKFYMVATDLGIGLMNQGNKWDIVQKEGSQALMVWESADLVNWSEQRMVTVSAGIEAGCTWAPESFYDDTTGEYLLFWASKVKEDNYGKQRIYYCKTRDFYTFTEPQVWIENSFSTIDTTVIKGDDGKYYRFSKNEAGDAKYIYEEVADTLLGEWKGVGWTKSETGINSVYPNRIGGGEGPCCFRINDDDRETVGANYSLLIDDFGGVRYYPMLTDDLASGQFTDARNRANLPKKPCHGTVMNITEAEYKALQEKWGTPSLAPGCLPGVVKTGYTLPAEIEAVFAGEKETVPVTWDKTADDFKSPGTVSVTGTFTVQGKTATETKSINVIEVSDDLVYFIDSGIGAWNSSLPESGYYNVISAEADLRNTVPDQLYQEGSWGIVNPKDNSDAGYENAGNRANSEDSIYANGWWAKDGKRCEYIIPLENGSYQATGYFAEWWNTTRPIKFYAEYKDASGNAVQSSLGNITLSGSNARQTAAITFTVAGAADKAEVHFYAENADGNAKPAPVIAGLAVEKQLSADDKTQLENKKNEAKNAFEQVTVSTKSLSLEMGGSAGQIEAAYPADLAEKAGAAGFEVVTSYISSDSRVAAVDSDGKVTAIAEGTAEITTTVQMGSRYQKSFTTTVQVAKKPEIIPTESVTLNPNVKTMTLAKGKKTTFSASVAPLDAADRDVTWESSKPAIASVSKPDKDGRVTVTAKKVGTATITASAGGKSASCTITVAQIGQTKLTLGKGESFSLKLNGTKKKAVWSSSNAKAVSVGKNNGKVKALKAIKKAVTITAKVDGASFTCKVTVKNAPMKITLNAKKKNLKKGRTFQLKPSLPKNTASNKITYKSSNSKVAKVDANGKVKALKKGKATITATTFNKKKATVKITVK